jgi:hypothetical protein
LFLELPDFCRNPVAFTTARTLSDGDLNAASAQQASSPIFLPTPSARLVPSTTTTARTTTTAATTTTTRTTAAPTTTTTITTTSQV